MTPRALARAARGRSAEAIEELAAADPPTTKSPETVGPFRGESVR
jgi:hypothetical protein